MRRPTDSGELGDLVSDGISTLQSIASTPAGQQLLGPALSAGGDLVGALTSGVTGAVNDAAGVFRDVVDAAHSVKEITDTIKRANLDAILRNAGVTADNAASLSAKLKPEDVDRILKNVETTIGNARDILTTIQSADMDGIMADVATTAANVAILSDKLLRSDLESILGNLKKTSENASKISTVAKVGGAGLGAMALMKWFL